MKLLTNEEIDNATVYEMKVLREQAKLANRPADPQQAAIKALREALLDAQYDHDEMGGRYCKGCRGDKEHAPDCWIQEALKLAGGM